MRILFFISLVALFATTAQAQTFAVTVNGGYGSGSYTPGDTVHVWADTPAAGVTFDRWTGDVATMLFDTREWHARLIMPTAPVTLTAVTKTYAPFAYTEEQIMGRDRLKRVFYYVPAAAKGVVTLHHGTGGSAEAWVSIQRENIYFAQYLVANGYGLVITEAEEITANTDFDMNGKLRWAAQPVNLTNVDLENMRLILVNLTTRGIIATGAPLFCAGMSNGGGFSAPLGAVLNMRASASYCADGAGSLISSPSYTVPRIWQMALYDQNDEVRNDLAEDYYEVLAGRGIDSEFWLHPQQPVHPRRFMRIGLTEMQGQDIITRLKAVGVILPNNFVRVGYDATVAASALVPTYQTVLGEIGDQIDICAADHKFYSDYAYKTLAFFDAHLPITANEEELASAAPTLSIYPQPARGLVWVGASSASTEARMLTVQNMLGQVVYTSTHPSGTSAQLVDASTWPAGLYLVQLGTQRGRLVVGR